MRRASVLVKLLYQGLGAELFRSDHVDYLVKGLGGPLEVEAKESTVQVIP